MAGGTRPAAASGIGSWPNCNFNFDAGLNRDRPSQRVRGGDAAFSHETSSASARRTCRKTRLRGE